MNPYTVAWIAWFGFFLVIEGLALKDRRTGDTLSEHIWRWASIKTKGPGWRARRCMLLAFLAWLVAHFLTGGWV